jgi:hypothetical protein
LGVSNQACLLFRLDAMNPLTNTEIVDDVDYFWIQPTAQKVPKLKNHDSKQTLRFSVSNENILVRQEKKRQHFESLVEKSISQHGMQVTEIAVSRGNMYAASQKNGLEQSDSVVSIDKNRYPAASRIPITNQCEKIILRARSDNLQKSASLGASLQNVTSPARNSKHAPSSFGKYRAIFFGTEDDFLSQPAFRELFELSALEPEDASLFEIPKEILSEAGIFPSDLDLQGSIEDAIFVESQQSLSPPTDNVQAYTIYRGSRESTNSGATSVHTGEHISIRGEALVSTAFQNPSASATSPDTRRSSTSRNSRCAVSLFSDSIPPVPPIPLQYQIPRSPSSTWIRYRMTLITLTFALVLFSVCLGIVVLSGAVEVKEYAIATLMVVCVWTMILLFLFSTTSH